MSGHSCLACLSLGAYACGSIQSGFFTWQHRDLVVGCAMELVGVSETYTLVFVRFLLIYLNT